MKMRKALHTKCSFHNVDFLELTEKENYAYGDFLLGSVQFMVSVPVYKAWNGQEDVNSCQNVLTRDDTADAVALSKWVVRLGFKLICFVLQYSTVWSVVQYAIKSKGERG